MLMAKNVKPYLEYQTQILFTNMKFPKNMHSKLLVIVINGILANHDGDLSTNVGITVTKKV